MLVQGQKTGVGAYTCPSCGTNAYYNKAAYDKHQREEYKRALFDQVDRE